VPPAPTKRHLRRHAASTARLALHHSILKSLRPALLLGADIAKHLLDALHLIAGQTYSYRPEIVKNKAKDHVAPHIGSRKGSKIFTHRLAI